MDIANNLTRFDDDQTLFILCDCKSEVLVIEYDHGLDIADLAIYENISNYSHKMSWIQKLRYIYRVIVNKKPYADQIILNKKQLIEIQNFLNDILVDTANKIPQGQRKIEVS